jgi:hypothetical protein
VIVLLVLWGIHRTLDAAASDLQRRQWSLADLRPGWLVASMLLYLAGMAPSGWFWHRVLRALGEDARLGETLRAYYIGHLGKYVPGKALVVILRAGLIGSHRVNPAVAAVSVFYETLTMMAVGACVAGVVLAASLAQHTWLVALAAVLVVAVGLPTHPAVFRRLVAIVGVGRASPRMLEQLTRLSLGNLALGWLAIAFGWCLVGLSLWTTLVASGFAESPPSLHDLGVCIAAASLAVVAGFLSLIPGGAGVREAVLIELLVPAFGDAGAVVSAIVARVAWLVAEVVASAVLYLIGRRPATSGPADSLPKQGVEDRIVEIQ